MVIEVVCGVCPLSSLLFLDLCGLGEALFIDLSLEGVPLVLVDLGLGLEHLLLLVYLSLVLEDALMYDFVLPLLCLEPLRIALVILELLHDRGSCIVRTHSLILDLDRAELALVNQLLVLAVSHLALLACLQLSIAVLLHHGCVSVKILTL